MRLAAAATISLAVAALIMVLLLVIGGAAGDAVSRPRLANDIPHLLRMTAIQAGLTTVLSLAVGIALAWALDRLRFPGRALLVGLIASAIVTPGIIVAFGVLAVWGRAGWINAAAQALFGTTLEVPVFGLGGILFAHVILDGAFAARVFLARVESIPAARLRTGRSLGLGTWQRFALLDWPAIRGTLPGLGALIFLLAFTSFPIVLLLGGGPANQTLEVAIYAAVRLEFDLVAAVMLALTQLAVCGIIVFAAAGFPPVVAQSAGHSSLHWPDPVPAQVVQWVVLVPGALGLGLPLLAVLAGAWGPGLMPALSRPTLWQALLSSLGIAAASALCTLVLALGLAMGRSASRSTLLRLGLGVPAYAYLAVPAVVLALGFFLLVRNLGLQPGSTAPIVVVLANALLALPFAMATLGPPLDAIAQRHTRLVRSLGLSGARQFWFVEWPLLGSDMGLALALAFCFSLGDLGVVALFGTEQFVTLPLLMLRALGAYRTADANVIAALMLALTVLVFFVLPPLVGRLARART